MAPDALRRHVVIDRQIFGALARGDDAEAGCARPVDDLRRQRRLVAIGQRVDHAGLARFLGEQGPGQHVGLDIDHDDMLAGRDRGARVADADRGIAGRFHHHLDITRHRLGAVGDKRRRGDALRIPADGAAGLARAFRIEIDDDGHFKARRMRYLRQEHRAELAGADQRHADGLSRRAAGIEEMREVHEKIQCNCSDTITTNQRPRIFARRLTGIEPRLLPGAHHSSTRGVGFRIGLTASTWLTYPCATRAAIA